MDGEEVDEEETTVLKGLAAILNFLSQDSFHLQFLVEQCSREMSKPTKGS